MAQFRMLKGISTALPVVSADTEGTIFYTYDDSLFHLDYKNENGEIIRKTLNAERAKKLIEARNITLTGDVSGSISFDGSEDVVIETTIANNFAVKEDLDALETILNLKIEEAFSQIESQFKLVTYENMITVASAGQTTFDTGFETFDPKEDTLQVHHGRLYLTAGEDYVLSGRQVVLNEVPEVGDTLTFTLLKNVPVLEEEITISPGMLEDGSIPLSKLEEMPVTATPNWNQSDANADDYIIGRTHYTELVETSINILEWDGNGEGLLTAIEDGQPIKIYKISDTVLEINDILGGFVTVKLDENENRTDEITGINIDDNGNGVFYTYVMDIPAGVYFVKEDGLEAWGITFPEAGIYTADPELVGGERHFIKLELGPNATNLFTETNEVVHKLDVKYLPDMAGADEALEDIAELGLFNIVGQDNILFQDENGKILIY